MSAFLLWQDPSGDFDALILTAVIELELEDGTTLANLPKGKQREGTVTDAEIAFEMYSEDLRACQRVLEDRRMAQSMALAVHCDGRLISEAHQQEDQVARDHRLAMNLEPNPMTTGRSCNAQASDSANDQEVLNPWVNDEMLEKAAALYNDDSRLSKSATPFVTDDSRVPLHAESSAWAALRGEKTRQKLGHCIACGDTKDFFDVARVPCNHEYCRECLESLFKASMKDESLFPPRCDGKPIQLSLVRFFLPAELAKEFEARRIELSAKNRVYCHNPYCSTFIPWPKDVETTKEDWLTCPQCERTTCTICKAAAHTGDCPDDTALQQLVETAGNELWQRCFQCHRFVDLEQGCNHMTCLCGAQFCYICGMKWKTCVCPQWEEPRLYERATQVVQRDPNPRRRLFQPPSTMREQPLTLRPSAATSVVAEIGREGHVTSPVLNWEPDFSDHSEWEQDWIDDTETTASVEPPSLLSQITIVDDAQKLEQLLSKTPDVVPSASSSPALGKSDTARSLNIQAIMTHLRDNHDCSYDRWRLIRGTHCCEECHFTLPSYIFECKQCLLQACNRCRRNRLR